MNSNGNKKTGSDLRAANMSLLLREIQVNGAMSRADIARATGLTRSTVSSLTQDLIKWKYLREIGYRDEVCVGKKATLLDIRQDKIFSLSVKLGNRCVYIAKVNLKGILHNNLRYELVEEDTETVISKLKKNIYEYLYEMKKVRQLCYGIGIAVPSPVRNGEMVFSPSFQCLEHVNLQEVFGNEFDGPVYVSNNADAAALAETWLACPEEKNKLVFILIDQGIGCGIVLDNEVYLGAQLFSNEFGHVIVQEDGPTCFCGNRGCLTSLASDWAIGRQVTADKYNQIEDMSGDDPGSIERLFAYMRKNPGPFLEYTEHAAKYLGVAVANLVDTLMPNMIIIDGNLAHMPYFLENVSETCKKHVHPHFKDMVNIRKTRFTEDVVLIGASAFLIKELYTNPTWIQKRISFKKGAQYYGKDHV